MQQKTIHAKLNRIGKRALDSLAQAQQKYRQESNLKETIDPTASV